MAHDESFEDDEEDLDEASEADNSVVVSDAIEFIARKSMADPPRLDLYIVARYQDASRAAVQRWIDEGNVFVNGKPAKASYRVQTDDRITLKVTQRRSPTMEAEDIPLNILYEDDVLVVIDKAADMIVHPGRGAGNWRGTVANALLFHFGKVSTVGGEVRPGIVHRLDRDTTGILLVAKDDQVHQQLALQFERRKVVKEYLALSYGVPDRHSDYIDKPIGHHPSIREKMAIREDPRFSKPAVTFYELAERFDGYSFIRVRPHTGRTHQIRVHLTHIGCPILADRPYAGRAEVLASEINPSTPAEGDHVLIRRQALHAHRLRFYHPTLRQVMDVTAPLPADMQATLEALRQHRQPAAR
jgi:23S rRNA pseudouridine1911/1915/1917 synthase